MLRAALCFRLQKLPGMLPESCNMLATCDRCHIAWEKGLRSAEGPLETAHFVAENAVNPLTSINPFRWYSSLRTCLRSLPWKLQGHQWMLIAELKMFYLPTKTRGISQQGNRRQQCSKTNFINIWRPQTTSNNLTIMINIGEPRTMASSWDFVAFISPVTRLPTLWKAVQFEIPEAERGGTWLLRLSEEKDTQALLVGRSWQDWMATGQHPLGASQWV